MCGEGSDPIVSLRFPILGRFALRTRIPAEVVALVDRSAVTIDYGTSRLERFAPSRRSRTLDNVREFWHDIAVEADT